jgi:hypothetical protein
MLFLTVGEDRFIKIATLRQHGYHFVLPFFLKFFKDNRTLVNETYLVAKTSLSSYEIYGKILLI